MLQLKSITYCLSAFAPGYYTHTQWFAGICCGMCRKGYSESVVTDVCRVFGNHMDVGP